MDHHAFKNPNYIQEASNKLTRWSIQLQSFDSTAKYPAGRLNVMPNALSEQNNESNGESMLSDPRLGAVCHDVSDSQSLYPPASREYKLSLHSLEDGARIKNDRYLLSSDVSVFPAIDSNMIGDQQRAEFGAYFSYVGHPESAHSSWKETNYITSHVLANEDFLFRSYLPTWTYTGTD